MLNIQVMAKREDHLMREHYFLFVIGGLYLAQGIPLGLAFEAFPVIWRDAGFDLKTIALVPLAGLPWALKFIWASFMENHWVDRIGRRKSWIIPFHLLTAAGLLMIAFIPPISEYALSLIIILTTVSLFSATQDIAIDALATERMSYSAYGKVNSLQSGGIMTGMLIGGPGSMYLVSGLGYETGLTILALFVLVCVAPLFFWSEPVFVPRESGEDRASISRLLKRRGVWVIAGMSFLVPLPGTVIFTLVKLFLMDAGWSLEKVGLVSGVGNSFFILIGCAVAAWTIARFGTLKTISGGTIMVVIASLLWSFVISGEIKLTEMLVWCLIPLGGLGIGLVSVGSYTIMMRFASLENQPGTDYTLLHSAQIFAEVLIASLATGIAASFGYLVGVSIPVLIGILTLLFILRFAGLVRQATHA